MDWKKLLKRIIAVIFVIGLIFGGLKLLNYILVDDTASYARLMMHEFYTQDNIDYLFVGASHNYRSVDPMIIEEKTGKTAFTAGTANQTLDSSFALIKEAVEQYNMEEIFLEVSQSLAREAEDFEDRAEGSKSIVALYLISDNMKFSVNKVQLLLNATSPEHYINGFWPARRYWKKITDLSYVENVLQKKSTDKYKNYSYYFVNYGKERVAQYLGKGHVVNIKGIEEHSFFTKEAFGQIKTDEIASDWKTTLLNIIDYCQEHNVKITLFDAPVSDYYLSAIQNYDEYIAFIRDLIKDKNVELIEFNLLKDEYFPYKQTNFSDGNHLNIDGAESFSFVLSDYLNGNLPESAFHSSISEKLASRAPDYYGITYRYYKDIDTARLRLISNIPEYYEYKVETVKTETGKTFIIQDFDTNSSVDIPLEQIEDADVYVTFREAGSDGDGELIIY